MPKAGLERRPIALRTAAPVERIQPQEQILEQHRSRFSKPATAALPEWEWKPWIKRLAIAVGVVAIIVLLILVNMNRNRVGQWVATTSRSSGLTGSQGAFGVTDRIVPAAADAQQSRAPRHTDDFESPEIAAALERRERKLVDELMKANGERESGVDSPPEGQRQARTTGARADFENAVEPTSESVRTGAGADNDSLSSQEAEMGILDVETDESVMQEINAPQPTSPAAPMGYVYAQRRLSILHDAGVVGIAPGARLAVIERRGENLLVSYEGYRGEVPLIDTRNEP